MGITYFLDGKVLTITYRHLILALVRSLRVQVGGRGCNVVRSTRICEPSLYCLSMVNVGGTSHCSKLRCWIFALVSKIHSVVAVNCTMTLLPTDLACRSVKLDWRSRWRLLLRVRQWWIEVRKSVVWRRSASSSTSWERIPASTSSGITLTAIIVTWRFVVRNKHSQCWIDERIRCFLHWLFLCLKKNWEFL